MSAFHTLQRPHPAHMYLLSRVLLYSLPIPQSSEVLLSIPKDSDNTGINTIQGPRHLFPWTRAECHLDIKHMEIVSKYCILYQSDVNSRQFFIRLNVKMRRRLLRRSNNRSSLPLFASIFNKVFLVLKTMVNRNTNSC